ncbi:hypothetical protein ACQKE4_20440 [Halomonas sp. NPDC076908]|uniref:hypothetical protein n=1 Tax=Halomonas sp. NPDC076908 TaxID=3390567 RepID=UPI003D002568|nr:hypothetical protein [Gammaproteobacteria bacterium]
MTKTIEKQCFNNDSSSTRLNNEGVEKRIIGGTETIPLRYQYGLGGIDIEQVHRDQNQAKREFIRAILKYLRRQR